MGKFWVVSKICFWGRFQSKKKDCFISYIFYIFFSAWNWKLETCNRSQVLKPKDTFYWKGTFQNTKHKTSNKAVFSVFVRQIEKLNRNSVWIFPTLDFGILGAWLRCRTNWSTPFYIDFQKPFMSGPPSPPWVSMNPSFNAIFCLIYLPL